MNNHRKISKHKNQIQIELSYEHVKEENSTFKKPIPRRKVNVLNKTAIQNVAIRNRTDATIEWVAQQHTLDKFENHKRIMYNRQNQLKQCSKPKAPRVDGNKLVIKENSSSCSKLVETEEHMTYAVMLMLLATCCVLNNV